MTLVILVLGVSFLAGALELRHPNYFLWDDNAAYFLPAYVYNWRSLVQSGSFPELNLHQYLGYQYLGGGQPGALYPPVYVALGLSRLLLGDLRHAVDLLAIGHLLAAALTAWIAERGTGAHAYALDPPPGGKPALHARLRRCRLSR